MRCLQWPVCFLLLLLPSLDATCVDPPEDVSFTVGRFDKDWTGYIQITLKNVMYSWSWVNVPVANGADLCRNSSELFMKPATSATEAENNIRSDVAFYLEDLLNRIAPQHGIEEMYYIVEPEDIQVIFPPLTVALKEEDVSVGEKGAADETVTTSTASTTARAAPPKPPTPKAPPKVCHDYGMSDKWNKDSMKDLYTHWAHHHLHFFPRLVDEKHPYEAYTFSPYSANMTIYLHAHALLFHRPGYPSVLREKAIELTEYFRAYPHFARAEAEMCTPTRKNVPMVEREYMEQEDNSTTTKN